MQQQAPDDKSRAVPASAGFLDQLFTALFIVRGPVAVTALTLLLLTVPAQTREIYRILALDLGALDLGEAAANYFMQRDDGNGIGSLAAVARVVLASISVILAALVVWYVARNVTRLEWYAKPDRATTRDGPPSANEEIWTKLFLDWLPRLCGATILLAFACGLWLAHGELEALNVGTSESAQRALKIAGLGLQVGSALHAVLAVLLILLTYRRTRPGTGSNGRNDESRINDWLFARPIRLTSYAVWASMVLLLLAFPVSAPQLVGTVPVTMLFVIIGVFVASMLLRVADRDRLGIPLFSLLAIWLLVISGFDWNDHHTVRTQPIPPSATAPRSAQTVPVPTSREAFAQWLHRRGDLDHYRKTGAPYPVFIVSASGGGLYAAHFAAATLARLQDECPAFAQHTFAVSGVSGGSLGAAVFAALAAAGREANAEWRECTTAPTLPPPAGRSGPRSMEQSAGLLLDRDMMSPIAAAAFFPDLALGFVPTSLLNLDPWLTFDRARAFELALVSAWDDGPRDGAVRSFTASNPMSAAFLDHWRAEGAAPALLLNTSEVSRGHRVVISPFRIVAPDKVLWTKLLWYHSPEFIDANIDISLATAIGLSARFPWILPAGSHDIRVPGEPRKRKIRVVDGGVFENSGVETAVDLLAELQEFETKPPEPGLPRVRFHLLTIGDFEDHFPRYLRGFSEIMSPVRALLSARSSRASFALARADERLCIADSSQQRGENPSRGTCVRSERIERSRPSQPVQPIYLNHYDHVLTLGWQLSKLTLDVLREHVGQSAACETGIEMPQRRLPPGSSEFVSERRELLPPEREKRIKNNNACTACAVRHILAGQAEFPDGKLPCSPPAEKR
jgi:hypothetical protein